MEYTGEELRIYRLRADDKITCHCGRTVKKNQYKQHLLSLIHIGNGVSPPKRYKKKNTQNYITTKE
jgi:hypothetical protein